MRSNLVRNSGWGVIAAICLFFAIGHTARAVPSLIFDYRGSGSNVTTSTSIPGTVQLDPTPGGHLTLFFNLPFAGQAGDLLIQDTFSVTHAILRFNGAGGMYFYEETPGHGAPSQTGLPGAIINTHTTFGSATWQNLPGYIGPVLVFSYTPDTSGPLGGIEAGYSASGPTYLFIIDSVPEPSAGLLVGFVGLPILGLRQYRKWKAARSEKSAV
jgi:hypothetical protein